MCKKINFKKNHYSFHYDILPQTDYLKTVFYVEDNILPISFWLDFETETQTTEIIKSHFEALHLIERYKNRRNRILSIKQM